MITDDQHRVLMANGWRLELGSFYQCRVCHRDLGMMYAYFSPNYAGYHRQCVMESPQVKRLFRALEGEATP